MASRGAAKRIAQRPVEAGEPVYFDGPGAFRRWLELHHGEARALVVGFHKRDTGVPSLTWPESVDEALSFGWIDGVRRRVDDQSYQIRFSPRKRSSIWSTVNIRRAEALIAEGRMTPQGLEAFGKRTERKSGVYSYEQGEGPALSEAELKEFRKHKKAWAYFEALPPGYKRTMLHWIVSSKQEAARARRFGKFLASCAEGLRLLP